MSFTLTLYSSTVPVEEFPGILFPPLAIFSSVFFSFSVMKADPCDPYPQLREFGKLFLHLSGGESTHIAVQVPH